MGKKTVVAMYLKKKWKCVAPIGKIFDTYETKYYEATHECFFFKSTLNEKRRHGWYEPKRLEFQNNNHWIL